MWAFCKAILAGAGRSSGLSVRGCAGGNCYETNSNVYGFSLSLDGTFCEALLAGSPRSADSPTYMAHFISRIW